MSVNSDGVNISGNRGDVIGTDVSGSNNNIIKNVTINYNTFSVTESKKQRILNKYSLSLKKFCIHINKKLIGCQIPEEKVKSINDNLADIAKEVEDIQLGKGG